VVVACTGGIGAGKTTVSKLLTKRGAGVVDVDGLARAALDPGTPGYRAVLDRFGSTVLKGGGPGIDRPGLARVVFSDPLALADLEAIVHPLVRLGVDAALSRLWADSAVVVLDLPLVTDADGRRRYEVDGVLVVDAPEEVALDRLVRDSRMDPKDARARMASQIARADRLAQADFVISNLGTREELEIMIDRAWEWIESLEPSGALGGAGLAHGATDRAAEGRRDG